MKKARKKYNKPEIQKIDLDFSISLVMMTVAPGNPKPRGIGDSKKDPFESPFSEKPFS